MENEEMPFEAGQSRNALQKIAMTAIYDALTLIHMNQEIDVKDIVSNLCDAPYEECDYFVKAAIILALKHRDEAIELFNANMNKWTFDRRNRVEQAILLLSYVHFKYIDPQVEKRIVIDIAVKLAKAYLDDRNYKFVNAILDKVLIRDENCA